MSGHRTGALSKVASNVPFIAKPATVQEFGCESYEQLECWRSQICGVCSLKMVGDARGKTNQQTLWQLTETCRRVGAFVERADGRIDGIFYKPLLRVAADYGLSGRSHRWLSTSRLQRMLRKDRLPVLSIDLIRCTPGRPGSHLVVVYDYDERADIFYIHDASSVLAADGAAVQLSSQELRRLSNRRGMSFA